MSSLGLNSSRLLCRYCNVYFSRQLLNSSLKNSACFARTITGCDVKDPGPLFFNTEVQQLLKELTRVDLKKVFRHRKDGQKLEVPEYKFMTTEELNQCVAEIEKQVEGKIQIPPVVKEREDVDEVLSHDPVIQGYGDAKFVFTDITYGVSDKDRLIVARDPDGTLRKASWDERFRMNQIYFPMHGRQLRAPRMFEDEYLKKVLDREEYEFILDRACIQFEPDDPKYKAVTSAVYSHIDNGKNFDALISTRHFGALVFHLVWNKCIDNLLLHNIDKDRLDDAVRLIQLYHIIHPEVKSASMKFNNQPIEFIKAYVELDSSKRSVLELALQTYQELSRQRQEVQEGILRAHGHSTV